MLKAFDETEWERKPVNYNFHIKMRKIFLNSYLHNARNGKVSGFDIETRVKC